MGSPYAGFGGLVRSTDNVGADGMAPVQTMDEKRLVEDPATGRRYWVTITQAERKKFIQAIPKGWNRLVGDREAGMSVEYIARREGMEYEEMRDYMAMAYGWLEQRLHRLAEEKMKRARRAARSGLILP